jgi:hypothetical protein
MTEKHRCNPSHNQADKGKGDGWYKSKLKNLMVKPHKCLRDSCRVSEKPHSRNAHRQHLKGSFKKTHIYKKVFCNKKKAQGKERKIRFRDKVKDVARYARRK